MILSVFVRRLKEGATFEDFIQEWKADRGFGVVTHVLNAQSLQDPRDVLSVGIVAVSVEELQAWLEQPHESEAVRHERIDTVIESTTLKCMYDLKTEHDFTDEPLEIELGSADSVIGVLAAQMLKMNGA